MKRLLSAAVLVAATVASTAQAAFVTRYVTTLNDGTNDVVGIIRFEDTADGTGTGWPDTAAGSTVSEINPVFPTNTPTTRALLIGTTSQALDSLNLVLFVSNEAAELMDGTLFEDVFPGFGKSALIDAARVWAINGDSDPGFDAAQDLLTAFADSLSEFVYNDRQVSAWFPVPQAGAKALPYSVVQFSSGQVIGNGLVSQRRLPDGPAIPEPSTYAMAAVAALGIVVARRQ